MGKSWDFPFHIEQVMNLLPIRVRRTVRDGVYTDCPFCGDARGKMKINFLMDTWRCNYCGEHGGMLSLYSRLHGGISHSKAYFEICDELQTDLDSGNPFCPSQTESLQTEAPPVTRAEIPVVHETLSAMLHLLKLSDEHREHLKTVRGLSDAQIDQIGFKSTPPFYMGKVIAKTLKSQGYMLEGVPGFYLKNGYWTAAFSSYTQGFLIPVRGIDGRIHGCQIRLDKPLQNREDERPGAKYIWLSSSDKPHGASSGSPAQFLGSQSAKVVYVTEGFLKSYIAHCLMQKTFLAIAGANNTDALNKLFPILSENGTKMIVEALDMDKLQNPNVARGAVKIKELANQYGMQYKSLFWDSQYKGIDDWAIANRTK